MGLENSETPSSCSEKIFHPDPLTIANVAKLNYAYDVANNKSADSSIDSGSTHTSTELISNPLQEPPAHSIEDARAMSDRLLDRDSLRSRRLAILFQKDRRNDRGAHDKMIQSEPGGGSSETKAASEAEQTFPLSRETDNVEVETESYVSTVVIDPSVAYLRNRLNRYGIKVHDFCHDPPRLLVTERPLPNPTARNPFKFMGLYEFLLDLDSNMSLEDWYRPQGSKEADQLGFFCTKSVQVALSSASKSSCGSGSHADSSHAPATAISIKRQKTLAKLDSVKSRERELPIPGEITRTLLNIGWLSVQELSARLVEKDWLALERYDRAVENFVKEHPDILVRGEQYRKTFPDIRLEDGRPWISRPHYDNPDEWFKGAKRAFITKVKQQEEEERTMAQENRSQFSSLPKSAANGPIGHADDNLELFGDLTVNDDVGKSSSLQSEPADDLDDDLTEDECLAGLQADGAGSSVDTDDKSTIDCGAEDDDEWMHFTPCYYDRSRHYIPGYRDRKAMYHTYQTQMNELHYNQRVGIAHDYRKFSRRQWYLRQQDLIWAQCYREGNPVAIAEVNHRREEAAKAESLKTPEMKIQEKWDRIYELIDQVNLWDEGIVRMKREGFWVPRGYEDELFRKQGEVTLTQDSASSWPDRVVADRKGKRVAEENVDACLSPKKMRQDKARCEERKAATLAHAASVASPNRSLGIALKRFGLQRAVTLDSILTC